MMKGGAVALEALHHCHRTSVDAQVITFPHLQAAEFFYRTDDRETQRGVPPTTTNHTDSIKHDGRGMDAARGFAIGLVHELPFLESPS
jgi:hypothetical protein